MKLKSRALSNICLIYVYTFVIINSFPLITRESPLGVIERVNLGITLLPFGGWFGIILFALSTKYIKNHNISNSVKYGIVGMILLTFNMIFINIAYPQYIGWGIHYTPVYYFDIISIPIFSLFYMLHFYIRKNQNILSDENLVRELILDFGTKLTRLKVDEIAERTGAFHKTIIKVVSEMRENKEIYARYFKSSNSVVFNQDANIEDIDRLMSVYNEWEKSRFNKLA